MILAKAKTKKVITNSKKPSANNEDIWKSAASPNSLAKVDAMDVPGENNEVGMRLALPITKVTAMVSPKARPKPNITPPILRESAYGLGCTTWEVVRGIVLPYTQKGVIGGIMLGLGRALGETMAVTFVIGNANRMPTSLFSPGTSIASTLANEFGEAADFHMSSLFALGFLLFVITFVVLALAKWMINRAEKAKGF